MLTAGNCHEGKLVMQWLSTRRLLHLVPLECTLLLAKNISEQTFFSEMRNQQSPVASPAMGHCGTCPPRLPTVSFLVPFGVNLTANSIQILCSLRDQLVQMSTTHSSFDHYYISHKTILIEQLLHPALKSGSPP